MGDGHQTFQTRRDWVKQGRPNIDRKKKGPDKVPRDAVGTHDRDKPREQ